MANYSSMSDENVVDGIEYLCPPMFDFGTISGIFFILIFIFSVTGNILLLCVLAFYEDLKNVTNLFVLNLACSDLVFSLTLPFWAVYKLHHWIFGDFVCKFLIAGYFVGLYSSVILLTAMTIDRFMTVVIHSCPINHVRRKRYSMASCAAAWVISIAASVIDARKAKVGTTYYDLNTCDTPSGDPEERLGYYLQVSLLFFLPFAIIVFCYSAILRTVLMAPNRRNRTIVVVLCIVAAFFVCWGPYNILLFIWSLYEPTGCSETERFFTALSTCEILAFSHCCMNPLLYMLSQKMRRHLFQLLQCKKSRGRNRERGIAQSTSVIPNVAFTVQNSTIMVDQCTK